MTPVAPVTPAIEQSADVLIVDDDPSLLRSMDRTVRGVGYSTFTAPNPRLAKELLRTTQFKTIVLDVWMPTQTGIELAHDLRAGALGPLNQDTPIVFATTDDTAATYEQTFDVATARCLIKPFDGDVFRHVLGGLVDRAA